MSKLMLKNPIQRQRRHLMAEVFFNVGEKIKSFFLSLPARIITAIPKVISALKKAVVFVKNINPVYKSACILLFGMSFVLTAVLLSVNKITISDRNSVEVVYSIMSDSDTILKRNGYSLSPYDTVETVVVGGKTNITVKRAFGVSIRADGEEKTVYMTGGTVKEALDKAGVSVGDEDLISISPSEALTENTDITVKRVTYSTDVLTESIPYEIYQRSTPLIKTVGRVVVLTPGQNGTKEVTVERKLIDGEEVERTVVSEAITAYPVTQVSLVGATKGTAASNLSLPSGITITASGAPSSYLAVYEGRGTAYSAAEGARTYSGRYATLGTVAVNKNIIPMGSILYVTSSDGSFVYGVAIAADTGAAVMQGKAVVDCFFPTYEESCWFGAKSMKVYVLG